jgi:hypothetical protein
MSTLEKDVEHIRLISKLHEQRQRENAEAARHDAWWATYRAALPAAMAAFPKVSGGGSTSWHVTPWDAAHDRAKGQADLAHGALAPDLEARIAAVCQEARTAFLAGDVPRIDVALAALANLAWRAM